MSDDRFEMLAQLIATTAIVVICCSSVLIAVMWHHEREMLRIQRAALPEVDE